MAVLAVRALSVAVPVVVGFVACWVGRSDFLVLIGADVIKSTKISIAMWSVGVLVSFALFAVTLLRPRQRSAVRSGLHVAVGGVLAVALIGTGVWCVGQAALIDGAAALGVDSYTVLRAPAGEGCALIAYENGALRSSSGQVYVVGSMGLAQSAGSWTADEIELPIRDGTYFLTWSGGVGDLTLEGEHTATPTIFG